LSMAMSMGSAQGKSHLVMAVPFGWERR
jgi:hypothetical protein